MKEKTHLGALTNTEAHETKRQIIKKAKIIKTVMNTQSTDIVTVKIPIHFTAKWVPLTDTVLHHFIMASGS